MEKISDSFAVSAFLAILLTLTISETSSLVFWTRGFDREEVEKFSGWGNANTEP